jgi:predicted Zn-dependent protease
LSALSCGQLASVLPAENALGLAETAYHTISDLGKDLTPENEYFVGRSVFTNVLAKHGYRYRNADAIAAAKLQGITRYVNLVGQIVANAALEEPRGGDRPAPLAGWHFVVVESELINAIAAPGGYVVLTTAAVKAARSEDELAAVLAHEVAHIVRGHALGTIKKSRYANLSKDVLKASGALSAQQVGELTVLLEGSIDDMIDAFFVKGYSKETEFDADAVGLAIMARAGYDPAAFSAYLETLQRNQQTGSGGFYQTHPQASDRIARLVAKREKTKTVATPAAQRQTRFIAATQEVR